MVPADGAVQGGPLLLALGIDVGSGLQHEFDDVIVTFEGCHMPWAAGSVLPIFDEGKVALDLGLVQDGFDGGHVDRVYGHPEARLPLVGTENFSNFFLT